ncbi:hypothetical protein [uncultured Prevotella sp.]|uniref:hypothetical protein n=1 Tax=uncultured Prevotella sp. TaxID=159272 RepID=UPI002599C1FD|nr:hypothetical protein [uncultured Prevotella sp.]
MSQYSIKKCWVLLLLQLFVFVQGVMAEDTKQTPTITFTPSAPTATVGQETFVTPTVQITVGGARARKFFRVSYKIEGGSYLKAEDGKTDVVDNLNHKYWVDDKTGTTVNEFTGIVKIGSKGAGNVKVIATATPSDLYKNEYDSGEGSYTLTVNAPTDFVVYASAEGDALTEGGQLKVIVANVIQNQWVTQNTKVVCDPIDIDPLTVTYAIGDKTIDATSYFDINNPTFSITGENADKIKITPVWVDEKGNETTVDADKVKVARFSISSNNQADIAEIPVTMMVKTNADGTKVFGGEKSVDLSFNVMVKYYDTTSNTEKIKTYLVFPTRMTEKYRFPYHTDPLPQQPKVYDADGNDVTKYYTFSGWPTSWTFKAMKSYRYSNNPLDQGNNLKADDGKTLPGDFPDYTKDYIDNDQYGMRLSDGNPTNTANEASWPDDYVVSVNAAKKQSSDNYSIAKIYEDTPLITARPGGMQAEEVHGVFYDVLGDNNHKDCYTVQPGEYVVRVHKRAPQIKIIPDPSTVKVAQNYVMTNLNRFEVKAPFVPQYGIAGEEDSLSYDGLDGHDKYWYGFFVPDEYKYTEGETLNENQVKIEVKDPGSMDETRRLSNLKIQIPVYNGKGEQKVNADGSKEYELATGTMYISTKRFGNDGWKVVFRGTGHIPVFYYVFPWNTAKWDRSSYSVSMFNIVEKEPVTLKVDPASYTICKGETSPEPHVWVEDQFGKDISRFYDFTWTVKSNGATGEPIIKFNDDYTSTGENIGTATIWISATKKVEGDDVWKDSISYGVFDNPSGHVEHKVIVTNGRKLYEVIYDDSYYLKDKDGKIVYDKAVKDDGSDDKHPIPYRKHAWTSKMGKLHFINEDKNYASEEVDFATGQFEDEQTPGLNITFGNGADTTPWKIMLSQFATNQTDAYDGIFDPHGGIVVKANAAWFGKSETETENLVQMPDVDHRVLVSGGCLQLNPTTNGFLQIDGNYGTEEKPVTYYLADVTDGVTSEDGDLLIDQVTRPSTVGTEPETDGTYSSTAAAIDKPKLMESTDGIMYGDLRFRYALMQGHTYYLFSSANTFILHGLTFQPAYVVMREDNNSAHKASLFADNGFSGDLPMVTKKQEDKVTFSRTWDDDNWENSYTPKGGSAAKANDALIVKNGYQFIGTTYTKSKRVRVRASVKGIDRTGQTVTDGTTTKNLGQVERAPYIDVAIVGIPVFKVGADFVGEDPGTRVSTTNFVTRMWMTFGGWEPTDQTKYPYYNKMNPANEQLSDAWRAVGEIDSVGMNNATIDGFKYNTNATNNPVDENGYAWKYNLASGNKPNTFNLPVRGGYVKFEPEESGTLMVYVLQNGLTDIVQNSGRKMENQPNELRRRAMYIVDETGKPVDFVSGKGENTIWGSSAGKDMSDAFSDNENASSPDWDYMTEGLLRCNYNDNPSGTGFNFDKRWKGSYAKGVDDPDFTADKNAVIEAWQKIKVGDVEPVIRLKDGSFVVPTKAFVRYTFKVKAGKTYYVWASGSKLNFCGYAFVPVGFMKREADTHWPAIDQETQKANGKSLEEARAELPKPNDNIYDHGGSGDGAGFADQTIYEGGKDKADTENNNKISDSDANYNDAVADAKVNFVDVTLNRSFKNDEWTSICLPFSVSQTQVKKVFGKDAQVITFDSVMTKHTEVTNFDGTETAEVEARTAHFTRHVNQLIEAGRPYFIRPEFSDNKEHASVTFNNVSFEAAPTMNIICTNEQAVKDSLAAADKLNSGTLSDTEKAYYENLKKEKAIFTFAFKGIYDRTQIPWFSYVMGTKKDENTPEGDNGNGLWRVMPESLTDGDISKTEKPYLKGFRAYLYPYSDYDGKSLQTTSAKEDLSSYWLTGADVCGDSYGGGTTGIEQLVEAVNTMMTAGHKGVYNLQGQMVRSSNDLSGLPAGAYIMNGKKYLIK